jgi:hypothetical protein
MGPAAITFRSFRSPMSLTRSKRRVPPATGEETGLRSRTMGVVHDTGMQLTSQIEKNPGRRSSTPATPVRVRKRDSDKRTMGVVNGDDHHGDQVGMSAPANVGS